MNNVVYLKQSVMDGESLFSLIWNFKLDIGLYIK